MINNQAASAYFGLLGSLVYNEPSIQDMAMLKKERLFDELPYAALNERSIRGKKLMSNWLTSAPVDTLVNAVKNDWLMLLMGVDAVVAPPWGSVYLDKDRLLFTEHTLFVRRYYEYYGFVLKRKYHEPDDHLGLELEFVSNLLEENKIAAAQEFTQTYICSWIDKWAQEVQEHAKADYYRALTFLIIGGLECLAKESPTA